MHEHDSQNYVAKLGEHLYAAVLLPSLFTLYLVFVLFYSISA